LSSFGALVVQRFGDGGRGFVVWLCVGRTGGGAGTGPGLGFLRVAKARDLGRVLDGSQPGPVYRRRERVALGQGLGTDVPVRIVEMVGGVAKGIDFQLREEILGQLLEEPVKDQAALDAALRVKDEDDLGVLWVVDLFFDDPVAHAHVCGGVAPVSLN